MRFTIPVIILTTIAHASLAQDIAIPVYDWRGNELDLTEQRIGANDIAELMGSEDLTQFDPPQFFYKHTETGKLVPAFIAPAELELIGKGDGIVDLPGQATMEFSEAEDMDVSGASGTDMTFSEGEGLDISGPESGEMTFDESEALNTVAPSPNAPPPPPSGASVTLSNGRWTSTLDEKIITGCPAAVGPAVAARAMPNWTKDITFSTPWEPADFDPEFIRYGWDRQAGGAFHSEVFSIADDLAQKSGMDIQVGFTLTPEAPNRVNVEGYVNVQMAAFLAQMAGGSAQCNVRLIGNYQRIAN